MARRQGCWSGRPKRLRSPERQLPERQRPLAAREEGERWGYFNRLVVPEALVAEAQALCVLTQDFRRAYDAFVAKSKPVFRGD